MKIEFSNREFVVATHNQKKRDELRRILEPLGFHLADVPLPDVEETGVTFLENARLKAIAGCRASGRPCIGDDSGLCVDALNGEPGVLSARYAGEHGDDDANTHKLLTAMHTIEAEKRSARFICVLCCRFPDGREINVQGACEGKIAAVPAGENGFGYDPVFLPGEVPGFTMAQLSAAQKDEISHRGRAILLLYNELRRTI